MSLIIWKKKVYECEDDSEKEECKKICVRFIKLWELTQVSISS